MSEKNRDPQADDRQRQSRKMEAIGRLTSGVAHDFNNLLMGIDGCAQVALRELPADHPARRYVERIKDAVTRGAGLTRQLLAFTRNGHEETTVVDLDEAVRGVEQLLRPVLDGGIELEVNLGPEGICVEGDDSGIDQILLNLVVNAGDAVDGRGHIEVRTGRVDLEEGRPVLVGKLTPGSWATLEVRDDGCGMDEATRARMFEPFFTTKPVGEGTGLGLSTVYGLVSQFDGAIEIESTPGEGTRFTIYLPVTDEAAPEEAPEPRADGSDDETPGSVDLARGVLLVEDNDLARKATGELLESEGFVSFLAADGGAARRLYDRHADEIALVVMDLTLPDARATELIDEFRAGREASLPILVISGAAPEHPEVEAALETSGTQFLQKPVGLETLLRAIRKLLAR